MSPTPSRSKAMMWDSKPLGAAPLSFGYSAGQGTQQLSLTLLPIMFFYRMPQSLTFTGETFKNGKAIGHRLMSVSGIASATLELNNVLFMVFYHAGKMGAMCRDTLLGLFLTTGSGLQGLAYTLWITK
ncbi:hypothetical protein GW17_00016178, partial [Ensete ventricosum]